MIEVSAASALEAAARYLVLSSQTRCTLLRYTPHFSLARTLTAITV